MASTVVGGRGHLAALAEIGSWQRDLTGGHAQATRHVCAGVGKLRRHGAATPIIGEATAWLEAASVRQRPQVRGHARNGLEPLAKGGTEYGRGEQGGR